LTALSLQTAAPRVLIVEDSADYALLTQEMLRERWGPEVVVDHAATLGEAAARAIKGQLDCIVLDLNLPDADGLQGLYRLRAQAPELPVVVLSNTDDEMIAVEAVREGAEDYLLKGRVDTELLARSINYAVERKHAQLELERLALHDGLTGLANRSLLVDRLAQTFARSEREPQHVSLFFCDLDGFKLINDSLGHEAGDEVLRTVAARLAALVRPNDTVARFGGDEFVLVCDGIDDREAVAVALRIADALSEPIELDARPLAMTASIGIAVAQSGVPERGEELIRKADNAMYEVKQRGGGTYAFHDRSTHERSMARLALISDLRTAADAGELRLHYQPIVRLNGGEIVALEALLRWQHPRHGLLQPASFIPLAEDTGLIVALGRWALRESCRQLAEWIAANPDRRWPTISVNVSGRQLVDGKLPTEVLAALDDYAIEPHQLCLELTETSVMTDHEAALTALRALSGLGVKIALDDFGTGHSSLSHLGRLPINILKIDRSFLYDEPHAKRIIRGVMGLAHSLGLTTLAEGIEVQEQAEQLSAMGCELGQGFYFAVPEPPAEASARLRPLPD
jgi:diguanylate cyclase (GGDEF)-like protein